MARSFGWIGARAAALTAALAIGAGAPTGWAPGSVAQAQSGTAALEKPDGAFRIAVFNTHLSRGAEGSLIADLGGADPQVAAVVEILQIIRPDIVLLLEIDYDASGAALALFERALAEGRNGRAPLHYPHRFMAPVNAGLRTGFDLDGDGKTYGPADAYGWGVFPGQFGMAILSAWPFDVEAARSFQLLPMSLSPDAPNPRGPDGAAYYDAPVFAALRLSSKSHWDTPVVSPDGRRIHLLASHPTPPVFDGTENRNGVRNAAEILFWRDYISGALWMYDDQGRRGGLAPTASFVVLGDLNADPVDGDGGHDAIQSLLEHPRVQDPEPRSRGGAAAAARQCGANASHAGDPALDTADWRDQGDGAPGNLRVDYVLPSDDLTVLGAGVFWPEPGADGFDLVGAGFPPVSSDHRLVWVDIALDAAAAPRMGEAQLSHPSQIDCA